MPILFPTLETYARAIDQADIYDVADKTSLQLSKKLSAQTGRNVWLKREDLQPEVASFKIRGAANKIKRLSASERQAGVITASAGNHAQGVALSAQRLGINATIVMPETTPDIKINAVRSFGTNVVLHGAAFPDALAFALEAQTASGATFIHPYDDKDVIIGQGTMAREIFAQCAGKNIEAIFVPVGGGGLIAGIAAWTKFNHPHVKIVGVEPEGSDCLYQALQTGTRVKLPMVELFADGVAVTQIGAEPFRLIKKYNLVDDIIRVSADEICAAAVEIRGQTLIYPEPAGALSFAGIKRYTQEKPAGTGELIAIISGANVDETRVTEMNQRAEIGRNRQMFLDVQMPEQAGSLRRFCESLKGYSINEFNYRHSGTDDAHIFVGLTVGDYTEKRDDILAHLAADGFTARDLTQNEIARDHIRHMVGGRPSHPLDETLCSFKFPERPGALRAFLETMPPDWDITLFNYHNHGASHGRVLMGLHAPDGNCGKVRSFIGASEFSGKDESGNPLYDSFLSYAPQRAVSHHASARHLAS